MEGLKEAGSWGWRKELVQGTDEKHSQRQGWVGRARRPVVTPSLMPRWPLCSLRRGVTSDLSLFSHCVHGGTV